MHTARLQRGLHASSGLGGNRIGMRRMGSDCSAWTFTVLLRSVEEPKRKYRSLEATELWHEAW